MANTFVQELEQLINKHSVKVEDTFSDGLFGGYLVKLKSGESIQIDIITDSVKLDEFKELEGK